MTFVNGEIEEGTINEQVQLLINFLFNNLCTVNEALLSFLSKEHKFKTNIV
jgi:hypothetical protein